MAYDPIVSTFWPRLYEVYPDFQLWVVDGRRTVAYACTLPVHWDGVPEDKEIASKWGRFTLKVVHDAKTPQRLELTMHMQLDVTSLQAKADLGVNSFSCSCGNFEAIICRRLMELISCQSGKLILQVRPTSG